MKNYFINTTGGVDVVSVIHEINRAIREADATEGMATIVVPAPGAAVTIIEPLPDLVSALRDALKVFPGEGAETKNRRKEEISIGPRVAAAMLGKIIGIPINGGKLLLGPREEPVIIDLETKGLRREFYVQIIVEEKQAKPAGRIPPQMKKG